MKKYRATIHVYIEASGVASAKGKAEDLVTFLGNPEDNEIPEDYSKPILDHDSVIEIL